VGDVGAIGEISSLEIPISLHTAETRSFLA